MPCTHINKALSLVPKNKKLKATVLCRSLVGTIDYTDFLHRRYLGRWGQLFFQQGTSLFSHSLV